MAYEPYERRTMRGGRRSSGMSAEQGQKDARDAINYQAGVERAMGQSIDPVIRANGRVSVEDWTRMGPAQRLRYAEQAPNDMDMRGMQPSAPQFSPQFEPMTPPSAVPQPKPAQAAAAVNPTFALPTSADNPSVPAIVPEAFPVVSPDIEPSIQVNGREVAGNPAGSISYRGRNGMNYIIGSDVAEADIPSVVAANRAGLRPSVEQMRKMGDGIGNRQVNIKPPYVQSDEDAFKESVQRVRHNNLRAMLKRSRIPTFDDGAQTERRNTADDPRILSRPRGPTDGATNIFGVPFAPRPEFAAIRRLNYPEPIGQNTNQPYRLASVSSKAPSRDGHPLPTFQPPVSPVKPPSLATIANLPPGSSIDPRRARMMEFSLEPY